MNADEIATWFLVFARASGLFFILPITGSANIPPPLRVSLAALMALITAPAVEMAHYNSWAGLMVSIGIEAGTGAALGFVCRMVFYCAEVAAAVMSKSRPKRIIKVIQCRIVAGTVLTPPLSELKTPVMERPMSLLITAAATSAQ